MLKCTSKRIVSILFRIWFAFLVAAYFPTLGCKEGGPEQRPVCSHSCDNPDQGHLTVFIPSVRHGTCQGCFCTQIEIQLVLKNEAGEVVYSAGPYIQNRTEGGGWLYFDADEVPTCEWFTAEFQYWCKQGCTTQWINNITYPNPVGVICEGRESIIIDLVCPRYV